MRVTMRLFAAQREAVGSATHVLDLRAGATAAQAFNELTKQHPQLARLRDGMAFAINRTQATSSSVLHEGDELALLPPVAGG
jgi:molybdopterin synthase sulfur carrier subunit